MQKYTKTKVIRITETQHKTLQKMKTLNVDVGNFIRLAISEKLQREKNLERQRRYRQTESYRKSLAKHRSTKGYKEKVKAYKEKLLEHRKLNPHLYKTYVPLTEEEKIKRHLLALKRYKKSDKGRLTQERFYKKNKNKILQWHKERRLSGRAAEYDRQYRPQYIKKRRSNDPMFRLLSNVRARLKQFLRLKNLKKHTSSVKLFGCTPEELKAHIEKQFKPGMTWENYGLKTWHIDHIKPLSLAKSMQDVIDQKLMHYTNLQPLWAKENISKSNKLNTN